MFTSATGTATIKLFRIAGVIKSAEVLAVIDWKKPRQFERMDPKFELVTLGSHCGVPENSVDC
jgi:hypothetical protein